jgi:hypothetical protein
VGAASPSSNLDNVSCLRKTGSFFTPFLPPYSTLAAATSGVIFTLEARSGVPPPATANSLWMVGFRAGGGDFIPAIGALVRMSLVGSIAGYVTVTPTYIGGNEAGAKRLRNAAEAGIKAGWPRCCPTSPSGCKGSSGALPSQKESCNVDHHYDMKGAFR